MSRSRDDFDDDDDFDGYNRARTREPGGRSRVVLTIIGAGIVLVMIIGVLALFVTRSRRTEQALDKARAAAQMRDNVVRPMMPTAREPAWPRMIGVWTRTPVENEEGGYPYQLEFRKDLTATTLRANADGDPFRQESTVEVLSDNNDTVRLRLHVPMGLYGYTLTLRPDGTLSLDDGKGGLVFQREQ